MAEPHTGEMAGQLAQLEGQRQGPGSTRRSHAARLKVIQLPLWPEPKRGTHRTPCCAGRCLRPFRARGGSTWTAQGADRVTQRRYHDPLHRDDSSTRPTWTCGNRPCTWPGRRRSAQSVISPPDGFLKALGRQASGEKRS